ncbi:hypothetical protein OVA24_00350 [Luteolibacter sp. SL250]|uniref:hypothetical protein n=1 Tax=Luteolibacter sp. SL250 TaxID=2995170 RepID=UPI00226F99EE|nr:hypothetical protein [Luteolibacter sp. SL250]WAC19825.1 hypothetical protein OVA24_00350 [Luteolibacter sp. SL250]
MTSRTSFIPYLAVIVAGAAAGWGGSLILARKNPGHPATGQNKSPSSTEVKTMPVYSRPLPAEAADPMSPEYYAQMAIWATEASAEDIRRFWTESVRPGNYLPGMPSLDEVLLARWVELDPEGAVRAFGNEMVGTGPAWTAWAKHDPEKALAAARASGRRRSVEWVIKGIAENDPARALQMIAEDTTLAPFVIGSITAQYAKEGKYREALDLKFRFGTYSVTPELRQWAKEDPHAAMRWCLDHPYIHPMNRETVYETFLAEYPDQANELIAILPDTETKLEFGRKRIASLVEKDPRQALTFVRSQQDMKARNTLSIELAGKLANTDWDTAAELYREYAANNGQVTYRRVCIYIDERNHTTMDQMEPSWKLLEELSNQRPKEAFELVASVPNENDRPKLRMSVVEHWMGRDRYGFSEFLAAQPASGEKDKWVERLAENLVSSIEAGKNDYPSSMSWAFSINDAGLRNKALNNTIGEWQEGDSSGFEAYLNDKNLPKDHRDTIRKLLTTTPNE